MNIIIVFIGIIFLTPDPNLSLEASFYLALGGLLALLLSSSFVIAAAITHNILLLSSVVPALIFMPLLTFSRTVVTGERLDLSVYIMDINGVMP